MAAIIKRLQSARSLLNWLKTVDGSGSGLDADTVDGLHAAAATYVPTFTAVTNLDAVTSSTAYYIRLGDFIVIWGSFSADATAGGSAATRADASIPVASNFTTGLQLNGVMATQFAVPAGIASADATNDRISFQWASQSTGNLFFRYVLGYPVL